MTNEEENQIDLGRGPLFDTIESGRHHDMMELQKKQNKFNKSLVFATTLLGLIGFKSLNIQEGFLGSPFISKITTFFMIGILFYLFYRIGRIIWNDIKNELKKLKRWYRRTF